MKEKESKPEKKEISQAGMARINLTFYTLTNIRRLINSMKESIEEANLVCEILGQSLLYQIGLDDGDVLKYHKEHISNIYKVIDEKSTNEGFKQICKDVVDSLPFTYNKDKDELNISEKLDGEIEKIKKKFVEGFT